MALSCPARYARAATSPRVVGPRPSNSSDESFVIWLRRRSAVMAAAAVSSETGAGAPADGDPAVGDPAVGDPAVGDPAVGDPVDEGDGADPGAGAGEDGCPHAARTISAANGRGWIDWAMVCAPGATVAAASARTGRSSVQSGEHCGSR